MKIVLIGTVASSILGFRVHLVREWINSGHVVYAFYSEYTEEQERAIGSIGAVPVRCRISRTGTNPLYDVSACFRLAKQIKKINPDLVLCYFSKPLIYGTIAAAMAGVRRRYGMIEGLGYYFTDVPTNTSIRKGFIKSVQIQLYRLAIPLLNRLIVLNPDDRDDLVDRYGVNAREVYVLGGIGLDICEFPYCSAPEDFVSFIFIGRLLVEKGVNHYLDAAEVIHKIYPHTEFYLLGYSDPGNPGNVDLKRLKRLQDEGVIIHPGMVADVNRWLAKSSVFVLPSYREGMPRSTQEAMAVGRAVITTDVPGCRETVVDGVNGFIVPPFDSDALARKMELFILDRGLINSMGKESRRIAEERYDVHEVNKRLLKAMDF